MVFGVIILAAFASVGPPRIEAGKVSISGKDWLEVFLAAQLIASDIYIYTFTFTRCAISWKWWSFQFNHCEQIIWAVTASVDVITFAEELSDGGFLDGEPETTTLKEKNWRLHA